jgi:hypothetical protein
MTYDEIVFEALAYQRNFGVRLGDIRAYAFSREAEKHTAKDDRAALRRLEEAGKVVQVGERWFLTPEGFKQVKGTARDGLKPWDAEWQSEDAWILSALLVGPPVKPRCYQKPARRAESAARIASAIWVMPYLALDGSEAPAPIFCSIADADGPKVRDVARQQPSDVSTPHSPRFHGFDRADEHGR